MQINGKNVLILGLAREGVSLARFLARQGAAVTATDSAPASTLRERVDSVGMSSVRFVLGGDHPDLVREADVFFVSPGVPDSNAVYRAAVERGLGVNSMTTLFFDLCPGTIVGITGSSGKTTTTALTGHIFRQCGINVQVGGNIGDPMLDLLPDIDHTSVVVLELSSFQLSTLRTSPHVSVVTNITPNHLDRHASMEEYVGAKLHVVAHQGQADRAILNARDVYAQTFAASTAARVTWFNTSGTGLDGSGARDGWLGMMTSGDFLPIIPEAEIPLLGQHNFQNVMAAISVATAFDIDPAGIREAIQTFEPAPHRLQVVTKRNDVLYIDDSIATTPARSSVALTALSAPVLLIAGGRDKHLPWGEFADLAVQSTRAVFLIGEASDIIEHALLDALQRQGGLLDRRGIVRCASLEQAVQQASQAARPGDAVLLSPGCASYDMFRDFEERAAAFLLAVEALRAA
ncbi:MAG: UDP-N-acetylmuramoyl-L-alanine--D-glutamate ligase [Chloroflexota bacterium]